MKKLLICITLAAFQLVAVGQTINVHFKNGQVIQYNSSNVDYVDFSAKPDNPNVTAGKVIDLGLSVLWSSCNLGASSPEEYGGYFAWGETKSKTSFTTSNYSFYNTSTEQYIDIGNNLSLKN